MKQKSSKASPPIPKKGGGSTISPAPLSSLTDLDLLTVCLYGEARGEGVEGLCAVGSVIMNRASKYQLSSCQAGRLSNLQAVILKPKQFSCFNPDDPGYAKLITLAQNFKDGLEINMNLRQCYWIAKGLLEKYLLSNVGNAIYYHTKTCDPKWDDKMLLVKTIGNHQFYVEK